MQMYPVLGDGETRTICPFWTWARTTQGAGMFWAGSPVDNKPPASKLVTLSSAASSPARVGGEPASFRPSHEELGGRPTEECLQLEVGVRVGDRSSIC